MGDDDDRIVVAVDGDEHAAFSDRGGNNGNDNDVTDDDDDDDDDDDEDAAADGEALSCLLLQLTPVKAQVEFFPGPLSGRTGKALLPSCPSLEPCVGTVLKSTPRSVVLSCRAETVLPSLYLFALRGVSTVTLPRP